MEGGRELKCRPHQAPEGFPEAASEQNIVVGDDASWDPMKSNHFVEEPSGGVGGIRGFRARNKMGHHAKTVDDHKDRIQLSPSSG